MLIEFNPHAKPEIVKLSFQDKLVVGHYYELGDGAIMQTIPTVPGHGKVPDNWIRGRRESTLMEGWWLDTGHYQGLEYKSSYHHVKKDLGKEKPAELCNCLPMGHTLLVGEVYLTLKGLTSTPIELHTVHAPTVDGPIFKCKIITPTGESLYRWYNYRGKFVGAGKVMYPKGHDEHPSNLVKLLT